MLLSVVQLLEEKRITFDAAYRIAILRYIDIKFLIDGMKKNPESSISDIREQFEGTA